MSLEKRILGWLTIGLLFFATIKIFWPNADKNAWNGLVSFSKKLSIPAKKNQNTVVISRKTDNITKSSDIISIKFIKLFAQMKTDLNYIQAKNEKLSQAKIRAACTFVHLCGT